MIVCPFFAFNSPFLQHSTRIKEFLLVLLGVLIIHKFCYRNSVGNERKLNNKVGVVNLFGENKKTYVQFVESKKKKNFLGAIFDIYGYTYMNDDDDDIYSSNKKKKKPTEKKLKFWAQLFFHDDDDDDVLFQHKQHTDI